MRTLKRIGFTSYIKFQKELKKELSESLSDPIAKHSQWATGAPKEHILNQAAESVLSNLKDTVNQISHETFNQVVDLIADQERSVHLAGGLITRSFSDYLGTHLEVIRKGVYKLPPSVGLWTHHLLDMQKNDVLVIFDVRRYEDDLLNIAKLASNKRCDCGAVYRSMVIAHCQKSDLQFSGGELKAPSGWDSGVATFVCG